MFMTLGILGIAGCVVGGGEADETFTGVTGLEIELGSGDVTIRPSDDDSTRVMWDGGGVGKAARPTIDQSRDAAGVVDARGTLGGGDVNALVTGGVPITAIVDRGSVSIELTEAAPIDACVGAGDVSIGLPAGSYDLQLEMGVGNIDIGIIDEDGGGPVISACAGAGSIDLHVTDPDALGDLDEI
ncbi:MAG: hypothetical protein ABMB14_33280 [Myxococcota bacterium]